jgi:hypothetical protein
MKLQRRDLILGSLPFGAALVLQQGLSSYAGAQESGASSPEFDRETYMFWTSQVHEPSESFAEHGGIVSTRGLSLVDEAEFLYYSDDTGFVRATSTSNDTSVTKALLPKGDATLELTVDTIRPSADYMKKLMSQKNASLRVDLKQAYPLPQLSETLNWSAIGALFPAEKGYMGYHGIDFDPKSTWGQAKKVPLPAGVGFWCWNFSTQAKPSMWMQVMSFINGNDLFSGGASSGGKGGGKSGGSAKGKDSGGSAAAKKAGQAVVSLGMPAIAKTALGAFNDLFGSMMAQGSNKTDWIIRNADTALLATQESRQKHPGRAVGLKSGSYLIVASTDTPRLLEGKYILKDGVVIPKDTKDSEMDAAAQSTLPEVSYIAISCAVEPVA